MNGQSCKSCRFFRIHAGPPGYDEDGEEYDTGDCRRNAPQPAMRLRLVSSTTETQDGFPSGTVDFPHVISYQWCGEYRVVLPLLFDDAADKMADAVKRGT